MPGILPIREECIEQAYFFRIFRDRLLENLPAQEILERMPEELLSSTRLPMAVQFLATEMKHTGLLVNGFSRLLHYFTAFQAFVIGAAEDEAKKLPMSVALQLLEREATYKAESPTPEGLFVYQFESISRNRLGYDRSLMAVAADPFYDEDWKKLIDIIRRQVGVYELADLIYAASELTTVEKRRRDPDYQPRSPSLFGEKEGKIAKASRGRDPLFLFAALQRQLNYPEVPRAKAKDDISKKFEIFEMRIRELESRMRMAESEARGTFDPTAFGKPDMFRDLPDDPTRSN
ncbi:MAG: hypothetical protein ACRCZF_00250 [Gemmataceae bacterium]